MRYANLSWQAEKARLAGVNGDLRGMTEAANKMERCGYYSRPGKPSMRSRRRNALRRAGLGEAHAITSEPSCWISAIATWVMSCGSCTW